jgi:hypothetical protein
MKLDEKEVHELHEIASYISMFLKSHGQPEVAT